MTDEGRGGKGDGGAPRAHLRARLLAMPVGAVASLAIRWVVRPRIDAWSVWGKGQCRCERPASEDLSLAGALDLLAPAQQ